MSNCFLWREYCFPYDILSCERRHGRFCFPRQWLNRLADLFLLWEKWKFYNVNLYFRKCTNDYKFQCQFWRQVGPDGPSPEWKLWFNPIRSRDAPQIFAITLRPFDLNLRNLVAFLKFNMKPGEIKKLMVKWLENIQLVTGHGKND